MPSESLATQIVHTQDPLNAEPSPAQLVNAGFVTPTHLLYKRNHGETQHRPIDHAVTLRWAFDVLEGLPADLRHSLREQSYTAQSLRLRDATEITAVMQCAGNRREEMSDRASDTETEGLQWSKAVAANLKWSGVKLRTLLLEVGVPADAPTDPAFTNVHIEFISDSECSDASQYASSVTLADAFNEVHPILIAIDLNGEPIPDLHGGPCRVVVPNQIGARSVKWLDTIVMRVGESENFYMQQDYKELPPDIGPEQKAEAMKVTDPLRQYGHQAVVTDPAENAIVSLTSGKLTSRGYAIRAERVEAIAVIASSHRLAQDEAERADASRWTAARVEKSEKSSERDAWQIWSAELEVDGPENWLVARAYTQDGTMQPKRSQWNVRGVDNSEWSAVPIKVSR